MNGLDKIIDIKDTPLYETMLTAEEDLPPEGQHQENILHDAVIMELFKTASVGNVTTLVSSVARLDYRIAEEVERVDLVTHMTLRGPFERAAQRNMLYAKSLNRPGQEKVRVKSNLDCLENGTQDVVIMNLLLDALVSPKGNDNLRNVLNMAAALLKSPGEISYGGRLIVTRPADERGDIVRPMLEEAGFGVGTDLEIYDKDKKDQPAFLLNNVALKR